MNVESISNLPMKRLHADAVLPTRAHPEDAGLDLYGLEDVHLEPGEGKAVRTGIACALPRGCVGMIADRSSLGKRGLKTLGGIIDAGYRGEIQVLIRNLSTEACLLRAGDRIAQMLILPIATPQVQEVSELDDTTRGTGGFGSTGA